VPLAIAGVALPALASTARADVDIQVPSRFLGGPIGAPLPVPTAAARSGSGIGRPSRSPATVTDPCAGEPEGDCTVYGPGALFDEAPFPLPGPGPDPGEPGDEPDTPDAPEAQPADPQPADPQPEPAPDPGPAAGQDQPPAPGAAVETQARRPRRAPAVPVAAPAPADLAAAFGGLVAPRPAAWLPWQTPTLRWRAVGGARYYNVQIFRGARRVLNAWPARPRLTVPQDVLDQGRTYVWVVWPGFGTRSRPRYASPLGRSSFAVTLRPRLVFHRRGSGVVAEVRPHIPHAVLRLGASRRLAGRAPGLVRVDGRSRFALALDRPQAERLQALLVDRGPAPPVGLRGDRS
jgi:hypothetical protein